MAGRESGHGPIGAALLAFERVAVAAEAARVREAGEQMVAGSSELVAALEEASAAAAGVRFGAAGGLLTGPALAECAELLARRARAAASESGRIADSMTRSVARLESEDREVGRGVAGAAG